MIGAPKVITLIMTGASGAQYGLRLLEMLVKKGIIVKVKALSSVLQTFV